jgi:hypothetical protein
MKNTQFQIKAIYACRGYSDGDTEIWNLTVPVSELPQNVPFGPNARNASLRAKPAKAMLKTLANEPEKFVLYNSGIMLIAETLKAARDKGGHFNVSLEMAIPTTDDEGEFLGHGVLNGGHTYTVLMHALYGKHKPRESYPNAREAKVQVSVAVGIKEEDISQISRARNLSQSVPIYALKNLNHDWKPIEEALPKEYRKNVIFKPDEFDEDAGYDVTDLVRRLALVNNKLFDFREDKHPIKAYASRGKLVEQWKEEDYKEVIPLLPDILWLEEKIMEEHEQINGTAATGKTIVISKVSACKATPMTLITGKQIDLTIGDIFYMPVLAAFRVLIKDGQLIEPKEELWEKWGPQLVNLLWTTYKTEGRSNASAFARSKSTWSTLTNKIAMQYIQI